MLSFPTCLTSQGLSEIFAQASRSGIITRNEHSKLLTALMENYLSEEEKNSIRRLLYAVRRNRIRVEGSRHFLVSLANMAS